MKLYFKSYFYPEIIKKKKIFCIVWYMYSKHSFLFENELMSISTALFYKYIIIFSFIKFNIKKKVFICINHKLSFKKEIFL